jgi:cell wall-associated NlpC family hydrolase
MVWWQPLIGRPYAFPSNPPESFDCWTLVRHVRQMHGLPCPLPFDDGEDWCQPHALPLALDRARPGWRVEPEPSRLAMAILPPDHVGVFVDGGVLHALARGATVVFTSMQIVRRRWPAVEWWQA